MPTLLELLANSATPTPPPPKKPEKPPASPLARSLLMLAGAPARTTQEYESIDSIWTPQDRELFLPPHGVGGSLPDFRTPHPPAKPLTIAEQFAQFGKAIQSIPEAPARVGAALREGIENLKVLGGAVVKGLEWLDRHFPAGPLDPYGRPVPRWNAQLYLLARRAYQGDYQARAIFLNEIGADRSPDNVLLVEPLLEPTFNPLRRDLRARWEQEPPEQARRKLRDLLEGHGKRDGAEEKGRKRGEHTYEVIRHEANRQIRTPSELADVERHEDERLLYERLSITLPERQFMFCWLRGQGMKYAEIAAEMGVGISTVKTYAQLAKNNPNLREMLGQ